MKLFYSFSLFVAALFGCMAWGSVCWQLGLIVFAGVLVFCLLILGLYGLLSSLRAPGKSGKTTEKRWGRG